MTNKRGSGLIKNIVSLGIVQIANYALPLISIPIVVRIIGPDKFGVINYATAFIAYFNLLIGYGFDLSATRKIAKDPNDLDLRSKVFSEVFYTQILLFGISAILFSLCLFVVPPLAIEKKVAIFSFLSCIAMVFTQNWIFQALQHLHKIAILNFISKLLFTVLVLIIIKNKADYIWQPLLLSLIQILIAIFSFTWAFKKYNLSFKLVKISAIKALLWEGRTIFFSVIVVNLYTVTNVVVLGLLKSETQVGYYSAGQKLVDVLGNIINLPLSQALFPFVGFAFSVSKENGIQTVQKLIPIVLLSTLVVTAFMFIGGPIILVWFYGKAFLPSILVFKIITFVPAIVALSNIFGVQIMINLNMDKLFFRITSIGAGIGLVLNFVMIHYYGYIGTAWNLLIVELYITCAMYFVLKSKNINPIDIKQFRYVAIKAQLIPIKERILKRHG